MHFRLVMIFLCFFSAVNAQVSDPEQEIQDVIESQAENLPEDYDLTGLVETLSRLRKHPLNLNNTTAEDLGQIFFLSPLQISNLLLHIKENGKLADLLELQTIDGFDAKTIQSLLPFVSLKENANLEKINFKNISKFGNNDLIVRFAQTLEKQKGFTNLPGNRYLGSPEKMQLRYKFQLADVFAANLTMDKDAGERIFNKRVDFISGNVSFYKLGRIKKLVIGDYNLQFGQGLTLWTGFAFGKSPEVTSVAKKDLGLRRYSSTNEFSFLRGASATVNVYKNIFLTPFVSFRKLDANQSIDENGDLVQATINQTGLHRSKTELENRNSLSQKIFGVVAEYKTGNLNIGAVGYHTIFGNSFITQNAVYDSYSFTGKTLTNIGLHYNYSIKNFYLFGEGAKSLKSGTAFVNGALVSLSPTVSATALYRNYSKDYHNFYNQAVAEATEAANEEGLYLGLNIVPNRKWAFAVYADYFKFPWLKFRIDAPSKGNEILSQVAFTPSKTFKILARFKTETKQQNTDLDVPIKFLDEVKKENYRISVNWQLSKTVSFQNRAEVSRYQKGDVKPEFGFLIYQDVDFKPANSKISGNLRVAYFYTASYNSRLYAYEDDVLYSFAFGIYNGKGFRNYLNVKYKLGRKLDVWARYGLFLYKNQETVGSYLDEIQGNKKSELKLQMRYQF
ncbi:hypothetical protein ABIB40_000069 [Pedobacter sp. UYP30]|uniref:helix-hairpin-helix domain-containing protein n=1 Tax=Pedobacter sp. UYP30 TaxID=1756400 RepID=UPI00339092A8